MLQILDTQGPTRDFVLIGGAYATAGGANFGQSRLFFGGLSRHIQRGVIRQDQWAGLRDAQTRTHLNAGTL